MEVPTRFVDKPFRIAVTDFFKGGTGSLGGSVSIRGKIEGGTVQIGERLLVKPGNVIATVKCIFVIIKAIEHNENITKWAVAGDSVLMTLTDIEEVNVQYVFLI